MIYQRMIIPIIGGVLFCSLFVI